MAKRFRFQLETLLRVREIREREAKRKVATQRADIAQLDRLNDQTRQEISAQQTALLSSQQPGQVSPTQLARGRAWIMHLRNVIAQREEQRALMEQELARLRSELQTARTQTRIIEKLRQRRWETYLHDRRRRERMEMDELAQQLQTSAGVPTATDGRSADSAQSRTACAASGRCAT